MYYECHLYRKSKLLRQLQYMDMSGTKLGEKLLALLHTCRAGAVVLPHIICQSQYDCFQDQFCLLDFIQFRQFPLLFPYKSGFGLINSILFY